MSIHATTRWLLFPYPQNNRAPGSYTVMYHHVPCRSSAWPDSVNVIYRYISCHIPYLVRVTSVIVNRQQSPVFLKQGTRRSCTLHGMMLSLAWATDSTATCCPLKTPCKKLPALLRSMFRLSSPVRCFQHRVGCALPSSRVKT